jgi:hypothetical protein
MDIKIRLLAGLILLATFNFSCTSTASLYKGFSKEKASLKYIYDSENEPDTIGQVVTIMKPQITDAKFTLPGIVRKTQSSVIPLIVYNQWKNLYEYQIGSALISEDIPSFVQTAFLEESKRSGTYKTKATSTASDDLVLEIEIDSIGAKGPYYSTGYLLYLFLGYSYGESESAGPGVAYSRFHYLLRKGDEVLMEDYTVSHNSSQPLIMHEKSLDKLRTSYTANLVESLAMTFKTNIEIIVEDIDIFLDLEKKKTK